MEVMWIKLSTALFQNRKIRQIEVMEDGDSILVLWLKLLILAGELNEGGKVYFTQDTPFSEEQFAVVFNRPRTLVALALRTFEAYGMVEYDEDRFLYISNWEKYQSTDRLAEIREYNRQAKQRERERKKDVNDCQIDKSLTSQHREEKKRKEKKREENITKSLLQKWQTNVDAEEANAEIRHG